MHSKIDQNYAYFSEQLILALEFAARAHQNQKRKDVAGTPYFSHPAGLAIILTKVGCREAIVQAAILHDVVEDTEFSYEDIKTEFGVEVADLVQWVTIPEGLKGRAGKEEYLKNLAQAPKDALYISAADMLYNRADIIVGLNKGHDVFKLFHLETYTNKDLNEQRIQIIEKGLSGDHELVKDLWRQNEIFIKLWTDHA